jgi:hypothetical protein
MYQCRFGKRTMPLWLTELSKLVPSIAPALAYAAATFGFFHWLDKKASPAAKKAFTRWLQPVPYDQKAIVRAGLELFDRLYTTPLLSVSAFLRSSLFTTIMFCIFLYEFTDPRMLNDIPLVDNVVPLLLGLLINILSDYVSLFVVRRWLSAGVAKIRILLVGPAIGLIVVVLFQLMRDLIFLALSTIVQPSWTVVFNPIVVVAVISMHFQIGHEWFGTTLSAFVVHLWLPLLVLSIGLLKGLNYFRSGAVWTQWFLTKGRDHPLDAAGYVAAIIVFVTTVTLQRIF